MNLFIEKSFIEDNMQYRDYLNSKVKASRLGFGALPLGNISRGKKMTLEEGVNLVRSAYEKGITFFDTAPNYANGESETILGVALKDVRDKVIINSKFGHKEDDTYDFSELEIRPSIIRSLNRLNTTYLDSILLHNPSFDILEGKTNHFDVLESLRQEGLIRGYGVSIDTKKELIEVLKQNKVSVVELLYNVFFQSTRDLLDQIKNQGIALIIKVPLDSGWLTGAYDEHTVFDGIKERWTKHDIKRRSWLVSELKTIIKDGSLNDHAISFLLSYESVTTVIPGMRNISQLEDHIKASKFMISHDIKDRFEKFYDEHIKDNPLVW